LEARLLSRASYLERSAEGLQSDFSRGNGGAAFKEATYRRYLATIRDRLPADLLALQESVSLHDGLLREFDASPPTGTLRMLVDGDDGAGGLRCFTLHYQGVTCFRSFADPNEGLPGPHGYGDWGYDEADVAANGEIVHRILFSSGVEFLVQFTGFELAWRDIAEPGVARRTNRV
jgi:hypothetical protein